MTHLPLIGALTDRSLFAGDDLVYLPSDRSILINEKIDQPDEAIEPKISSFDGVNETIQRISQQVDVHQSTWVICDEF
jgi:hypothetical protein